MAKPRLLNMCGKIVPYEDARVHVLSTAMKYAASVYEAIAYWSERTTALRVPPARDLRRLERIGQDLPHSPARGRRQLSARRSRSSGPTIFTRTCTSA